MPNPFHIVTATVREDPRRIAVTMSLHVLRSSEPPANVWWINQHHNDSRPFWWRGVDIVDQPDPSSFTVILEETTYPAPDLGNSLPEAVLHFRPHTRRLTNEPNGFPYSVPGLWALNLHPFVD